MENGKNAAQKYMQEPKDELKKLPLQEWVWIKSCRSGSKDLLWGFGTRGEYYKKSIWPKPEEEFGCGYPGWGTAFDYCDYGKTWIAYRYKPEEGTYSETDSI